MRWFLAALLVSAVVGCNSNSSPAKVAGPTSGGGAKKLHIAVIPKGTTHHFWKSVHHGALKAAEELGDVEIEWNGPNSEADVKGQIQIVKSMLVRQVDGIVLAPNDSSGLVPVVKEANADRIPVVIFDSGLGAGAEIVSYVATDNENGGRLAAKQLAQAIGEEGEVILMRYRAGSESTLAREEGFLKELKESYPKIKVLSENQYGGTSPADSNAKGKQLLQQFEGEVDGVFAVCEPNAIGMLLALESNQQAGKVKFVAFDPSDTLIKGLADDTVHGIVLQDPVQMGYASVKALVGHLRGEKVEARIPTGEHVATKENLDSDEMKKLLHPETK